MMKLRILNFDINIDLNETKQRLSVRCVKEAKSALLIPLNQYSFNFFRSNTTEKTDSVSSTQESTQIY